MSNYGHGKDFWIDTLRLFTRITFIVIIIVGVIIGYNVSYAGRYPLYFVIPVAVSIIVGILTVGFVMVFLNMAMDIRITREYLVENGGKWIPVATNSQQSNKATVASVSKPVNSTKCKQCNNELKSGEKFCASCGVEIKEKMSDINIEEEKHNRDFIELCKSGTLQEIETAIKNGAGVNARSEQLGDAGKTAFIFAVRYNPKPEIVSLLLKNGADVNAKDKDGWTSLIYAASSNPNPEVISVLLENGANVNARAESGQTALMRAVRYNSNPEVISVLLKKGADASIKDNKEKRAIDYASGNENIKGTKAYEELSNASN